MKTVIKNIILLFSYILALPILLFVLISFGILWLISCVIDIVLFENDEELDMWKLNESFDSLLSKIVDKITGFEDN